MSEEKKGIEFGKEWIGELPLQKQMREDAERLRGELHPDDGYVPKGEIVEIPIAKIVYSESVGISRGADGEVHELGEMKKTYFPALGKLVELPAKKMPDAIPPWEELPNEAASDDMSDEGPIQFEPIENGPAQVGLGVKAFCDELLNGTKLDGTPAVKVTSEVQSPEEAAQGYSWKLNIEVKDGKVANTEPVPAENVGDGWGAEIPPEQQTPEVQTGIPEDKLREVTVPFPADKIREYFGDKSLFFIANYSESKLKGGAFLTYLSNINIPSDVKFNTPIGYEEYAEIMKAYMEQPGVVSAAGLHVMAAEMLLVAKGLPYERTPYALPIDEKVILMFIEEHRDMVQKWLHFIDSTQVYALRSIKALNEHYKPEERFPVVEDRSYVGSNIAQLFRIPEFIAVYFSIPNVDHKLSYFKDQFEEYMFKNERLAHYFGSQNNFAALYFTHFAAGSFEAKHIEHGLFRLGVFDPVSPYYEETPYVASLQV
uniref:Uncharacterized protein n=1 Tax=Burkholderia phage vB_BgluM-SURPRISE13 TaxID=3159457 RepID=A0AAU7PF04_9VIRU